MQRLHVGLGLVVLGLFWLAAADAPAQQMTVGTPYHSINEGFHERIGSSWSLQGRNWFFRFGGLNSAVPQFGGHTPNAGAQFGFGFGGGGLSGNFFGTASQGNTRAMTSQTPSVTIMNGQRGSVSDTSQSPFVIGFIPVVGGFPSVGFLNPAFPPPQVTGASQGPTTVTRQYLEALRRAQAEQSRAVRDNFRNDAAAQAPAGPAGARNPALRGAAGQDASQGLERLARAALADDPAARKLAASQRSSAGRPVVSVAEARQAHEAQQAAAENEALVWLERARGAEEAGKANVAAIYYRMAAGRANGQLRQQALDRLQALKDAAADDR